MGDQQARPERIGHPEDAGGGVPDGAVRIVAPSGVPEVREGDDIAALVAAALELADGDIVLITSKVLSKAEGRVYAGERGSALADETARVVARVGETTIVRNRLGLTMAAAGIDESNIEPGRFALLPADPDASARAVRTDLARLTGRNVAVVVTDTAGRAWRVGQTDLAVGAAGLQVVEDLRGRTDRFGTSLRVTLPAVADELASAAELAAGKLDGRPFVRIRGRADLVLPPGDHGPGAAALIRPPAEDLFGYGAREAVLAALRGGDPTPFGRPAGPTELAAALEEVCGVVALVAGPEELRLADVGPQRRLVRAVAFAHGWVESVAGATGGAALRLRPWRGAGDAPG